MKKKVGIIKRVFCIGLIFLLNINVLVALAADNNGSAFITKAEFDSLKNDFQSQINDYNMNIDSKIDSAVAAYLASIREAPKIDGPGTDLLTKVNSASTGGYLYMTNTSILGTKEEIGFKCHIATLFRAQNLDHYVTTGIYEGQLNLNQVDTGSDTGNALIYQTQNGLKNLIRSYTDFYVKGDADAWAFGTYKINGYTTPYPETAFVDEQNSTFRLRLYSDSTYTEVQGAKAGGVKVVKSGETDISNLFYWNGQTHTTNSFNFIDYDNINKLVRASSTVQPATTINRLYVRRDGSPQFEILWGAAPADGTPLYYYYPWSPVIDAYDGIKEFGNNAVFAADQNVWWGWDKGIPLWRMSTQEKDLKISKNLRFYNATNTASSHKCSAELRIYNTKTKALVSTPWSSSTVTSGDYFSISSYTIPSGCTLRLVITSSTYTNDKWRVYWY